MQVSAHGISLEVENHGPPLDDTLLFIMGLGVQLLGWQVDFVAALVHRGLRIDNRDIGLSVSLDSAGQPNLAIGALRFSLGPYAVETFSRRSADCGRPALNVH